LQTLSFNNSANASLAWQVAGFGFLKVQLCIIGVARVTPRGLYPFKFLAYLVVCSLRGGTPKQILLLA